jgi:hypothetical protein
MLPTSADRIFAHLRPLHQICFHLAAAFDTGTFGVVPLLLIIGIAVEHFAAKIFTFTAKSHLFFLSTGCQFTGAVERIALCGDTASTMKLLPILALTTAQPTIRIHSLIHVLLRFLQYL